MTLSCEKRQQSLELVTCHSMLGSTNSDEVTEQFVVMLRLKETRLGEIFVPPSFTVLLTTGAVPWTPRMSQRRTRNRHNETSPRVQQQQLAGQKNDHSFTAVLSVLAWKGSTWGRWRNDYQGTPPHASRVNPGSVCGCAPRSCLRSPLYIESMFG